MLSTLNWKGRMPSEGKAFLKPDNLNSGGMGFAQAAWGEKSPLAQQTGKDSQPTAEICQETNENGGL